MSCSASSARRGSLRISDEHAVDAVEQEVRADARLQRLQPRLDDRGRERAGAQLEVVEQTGDQQQGEAEFAQQRVVRSRRDERAERMSGERGAERDARSGDRADPIGLTRDPRRRRPQQGEREEQRGRDRPRGLHNRRRERLPTRFAHERGEHRRAVDGEQDAHRRAQVAQVR